MTERHNRHSTNTDSGQDGSASGKSNNVQTKKSASEQHLSHDHFDFMLDWLGRPGNYTRVFGASGNTTIGVKDNKSAKVAIEEWANHVSKAGSFQLTGVALKAEFTQYLGIYKGIKRAEQATGYGLTEDDYNKNIRTLAQKYGKECHAFERMDRIFSSKLDIHALASMEGGLVTTLKVRGVSVDVDLYDRNDDEGTIFGQANDTVLSAEDDGVVLQIQDGIFSVENDPLEGTGRVEEEVAAPAERAKRGPAATTKNSRDKRPKTNTVLSLPPPKMNTKTSQRKSASFSNQFFERMDASTQFKKDLEQDKLDWDKEKWRLECQLRKEERKEERKVKHMADIESKRLAAIVALVQQGVTDKDVILSIVGSGSKNE
ncbi:MAG: hypothetical protein J3R72DRAFT_457532 [Linnemannia gamsii]|nr:MAG: hypothetical protein J3R72DRAFT_457532 [Linnemannia gamsii]